MTHAKRANLAVFALMAVLVLVLAVGTWTTVRSSDWRIFGGDDREDSCRVTEAGNRFQAGSGFGRDEGAFTDDAVGAVYKSASGCSPCDDVRQQGAWIEDSDPICAESQAPPN